MSFFIASERHFLGLLGFQLGLDVDSPHELWRMSDCSRVEACVERFRVTNN
jgi:hypothetical protein